MKIVTKYNIEFIKYYCKKIYFILPIFISFIFALVYSSSIDDSRLLINAISLMCDPIYFSFCLLLPILINAIIIQNEYDKNIEFIIRKKNKRNYFNDMIRTNFIINLLLYLFILVALFVGVLLINGFVRITTIEPGAFIINPRLFSIYHVIRIFIFLELFSIIIMYLLKMFNKYIVVLISTLLIAYSIGNYYDYSIATDSIKNISFDYTYYFASMPFSTFSLNLICTLINIIIYASVAFVLSKFVLKKIKEIGYR